MQCGGLKGEWKGAFILIRSQLNYFASWLLYLSTAQLFAELPLSHLWDFQICFSSCSFVCAYEATNRQPFVVLFFLSNCFPVERHKAKPLRLNLRSWFIIGFLWVTWDYEDAEWWTKPRCKTVMLCQPLFRSYIMPTQKVPCGRTMSNAAAVFNTMRTTTKHLFQCNKMAASTS